jgi:hypothetical protein
MIEAKIQQETFVLVSAPLLHEIGNKHFDRCLQDVSYT